MAEPIEPEAVYADDGEALPADLRAAFDAYERALAVDDLAALDAAFAPGPGTIRADGTGVLVGHDAISRFRGSRGGVAPRVIERLEARRLAPQTWLLVATSRYAAGGTGVQTQVWQRVTTGSADTDAGRWVITAAHVTPRAQAFDRSIWRTVGDPLYQGAWEGPLAGLTVAVKDLFAIRGYRIGAGNPTWLEQSRPETTSAPAVADLLRAGASLRGIARTDELAYSVAGANAHYGTPPNGAVPGALPGGSSSGPASAVATGQADVALATDTAGSIRVPASYQGLWGLRTTHGLVPRQGLLPLAQSFDTVGWLTRDGATLERVVAAALGADGDPDLDGGAGPDGAASLPWHLAIPREVLAVAEPGTAAALAALVARLRGVDDAPAVEEVDIGDLAAYAEPFRVVQAAEAWRNHGAWVTANPGALGAPVAHRMQQASTVTAAQEAAAREELALRREHLRAVVTDRVLLMPTVPGPAPSRATSGGDGAAAAADDLRVRTLRTTTPASAAGLPSISVPLVRVTGASGAPAPVGLCLTAASGSDLALVQLARRLADLLGP
ncbi:AtzH-like domain-containing protein [Litorihabitans aurantiacus]|uniref:Amidase domain-containing protein n=1 Tax=Litorihabitans aurantiacus TaxID=1930061 RepID=A0AA37XCP8_9MICO|nr:AtzH-like domain-containing protein [Litorihabitans aurantiacus]GMA30150.1 hypothetical protein GCM10025875_01420 [Litorihabitans aurantiacus]